MRDTLLNSVNQNQLLVASSDLNLRGMYTPNAPDLSPLPGSPAFSGASFADADLVATFFNVVTYRGAVGTDNWAASSKWAVWK